MKKFLQSMIERKQAEVTELVKRSNESESIEEVRSLGAQIDKVNAEVRELEAQMVKADEVRGFNPLNTYGVENTDNENLAYRSAFMNLVLRNKPIPAELRDNTLTSDVASVIPTQLVARIVEKMDHCGMILARVTRTSFKGGIAIPTSNVKPVATWVAEGAGSDRQKKSTGTISFTYHKLRCEISMSIEVGEMALSVFEAKFVENVAKAMVIAIEKAILNGNGSTQPKGILQETGIDKAFASAVPTYAELLDVEASVPVEHEENAVWLMTKTQFYNIQKMVDKDGQPVARVNYGLTGKPEYRILGREVLVHPYAEEMGTNACAIVNLADYVFNTVYDMGISKKPDWDTEDLLTKAVMSVDGKLVDTTSLIKVSVSA